MSVEGSRRPTALNKSDLATSAIFGDSCHMNLGATLLMYWPLFAYWGFYPRGCWGRSEDPGMEPGQEATSSTKRQFNKTGFPIRVIDLDATLGSNGRICFHTPVDWDFHVISYPWNLGVRQFTETIANLIKQLDQAGTGSSTSSTFYNQSFERADFRTDVFYGHLIEFFGLLAADGVKMIWLDALCINQGDLDEKSREISHMGVYYSNSRGCYVLPHGVGEGHKAWYSSIDGEGVGIALNEKAPRLFQRVWTLQEFILPQKLYFLVGGLSRWTTMYVNRRIRSKSPEVGFCTCCLLPLEHYYQSEFKAAGILRFAGGGEDAEDHAMDDMSRSEFEVVRETSEPCAVCGTLPLIRRIPGVQSGEIIYCIDRDAYIFIVSIERWAPAADPSLSVSHIPNDYGALLNLFNMLSEGYRLPWRIISAIGNRDCSLEEDRMLSILGLLRLEHLTQLRAGKTLEEQIVGVAKVCEPDILIRVLCAVDYEGNSRVPGMSWAPNFHGSATRYTALGNHEVQSELKVIDVSLQGMRLAGCKILKGHIKDGIYDNKISKPFKKWCPVFIDGVSTDLLDHLRVRAGLYIPGAMEIHFNTTWWGNNGENIGFIVLNWFDNYSATFSIEFSIWIILLGQTMDNFHRMRMLTMVCVGTIENFHKVGLISFPLDLGITLFQHSLSTRECCIGGFGMDISDYVTLHNLTTEGDC